MESGSAARRLAILQGQLRHAAQENAIQGPAVVQSPCSFQTDACAVVIGGMILDVQATPAPGHALAAGGSVPGRVMQAPGGVARNIAHSLALLAASTTASAPPALPQPLLISAVGTDAAGATLLAHWRSLGASTACVAQIPGAATPCVSIIFDGAGDVAASVADVWMLERELTPALLRRHADSIAAAPLVVIDADLSAATIQEACQLAARRGARVWLEPVSAPKSRRALPVLHLLDYISPNSQELVTLAQAVRQQQCPSGQSAFPAPLPSGVPAALAEAAPHLQAVLQAGVRCVVLTLGALGAATCRLSPDRSSIQVHHGPALPAKIVNCSGAGDCLVAGFGHALLLGHGDRQALAWGLAAAKRAVQSPSNVPLEMDASALKADVAAALRSVAQHSLACA